MGGDYKQKSAEVKPAQETIMKVMDSVSESARGYAKATLSCILGSSREKEEEKQQSSKAKVQKQQ